MFQLVNAGRGSDSTVAGRMIATADQAAGIGAGLAGVGAGAVIVAVAFELFANVYAWRSVFQGHRSRWRVWRT